MNRIYLDHNATTPIHPLVADAMADSYRADYANPASQHHFGREARKVLEDAREGIARILGANISNTLADHVVFTSGGTESNNLALLGLAGDPPGNVVISAIEHPSVVGAAERLRSQGFELRKAPVTPTGAVDLDQFHSLIDDETHVASVMLGNNETGVLQPVAEIAEICNERDVPLHTDAVQVAGKLPVDFRGLGVAALSTAAHKSHGPRGIGALIVRHDCHLQPIHFGGFQQMGLRPGTESVVLAVGMHKALQLWQTEAEERMSRMTTLRNRLELLISTNCPESIVVGIEADRLPHTSNIAFPGLDRQAILMALDVAGVACSTGSACASGSSEPSPVLLAMGCLSAVVEGSIRFSLGAFTTAAEIDEAVSRILKVIHNLRAKK